jgi:hypothetical protein
MPPAAIRPAPVTPATALTIEAIVDPALTKSITLPAVASDTPTLVAKFANSIELEEIPEMSPVKVPNKTTNKLAATKNHTVFK